jgi:hypothetical protein
MVTMCCNGFRDDLYNRAPTFYATRLADSTLMMELLRLYGQIALLRRGPQDVPASPLLLFFTVAAFIGVNSLVSALLPPMPGPWMMHLLVEVLFMLAFYAVLLRQQNKSERFLQTATALFGYQIVLSPLIITLSWLVQRFQTDPAWFLPVLILALVLAVWLIAAGAHIVKSALEWSMQASVSLFIAQILAGQLLILALFNPQV